MAEIIVSPRGNDSGSGSLQKPLRTLKAAIAKAKPGDTISLRAGEYAGDVTINKSNLTIQSYKGEKAVISAPVNADEACLRFGADTSGSVLRNVEVRGGFYAVMFFDDWNERTRTGTGASDITVENCKLHDTGRDVIKITPGCDNIRILNNEIYNSGMRDGPYAQRNAEGIDIVNGDRIVIRGNYIHDTATTGVYFKGGSRGVLVEDNYIINTGLNRSGNSGAGIGIGYGTDLEYFDASNTGFIQTFDAVVRNNTVVNTRDAGIMIWGSSHPQVIGNILFNVATYSHSWMGGGIFIDGMRTSEETTIFTNTSNPVITDNIIVLSSVGEALILARPAAGGGFEGVTGRITIDRNIYYQLGRKSGQGYFGEEDTPLSFSQWQARGLDQNGSYRLGVVVNLNGTKGSDTIRANKLNNVVKGLGGNDYLIGDFGEDRLYGGDGKDRLKGGPDGDFLFGGRHNDILSGGSGRDVFVFDTKPNKSTNRDKITDFVVRDDSIYLDNKFFKGVGSGSLSKPKMLKQDAFVKGPRARDAEDRIIYDSKKGYLYYDKDGTGPAKQVLFATLSKNLKLTHEDFFVI